MVGDGAIDLGPEPNILGERLRIAPDGWPCVEVLSGCAGYAQTIPPVAQTCNRDELGWVDASRCDSSNSPYCTADTQTIQRLV